MNKENDILLSISKWLFILVSLIFVIYATVTMRGMYMDGSFFMLQQLSSFDDNNYMPFLDFTRVRFIILFIMQAPLSFSGNYLQVHNKYALMMIFSCSQFLLPLLALLWNYNLTKRTNNYLILFWSLLNYCLILITFSTFSMSETLIGSTLHFILWNYLSAKIDYKKTDIVLILFLVITMFATWEYVIFLGPIFFIASILYANRETDLKSIIVKRLIGIGALFASIFNLIYIIRIMIIMPGEGTYFLKELYDYFPQLLKLCSLMSIAALVFLFIALFIKNKITYKFALFLSVIYSFVLIRLLNTLDVSLVPMWEGHFRSIEFWFLPLIFFAIFIFDLLKKEYNPVKFRNYIIIVLLCGVFQTTWQLVHTYYWDENIKYMKDELNNSQELLYIPSEHEEISSFFNPQLRRYIWWGNYALMSILFSDTYDIKHFLVNYDYSTNEGNKTFRNKLFVIPEENHISIPYGIIVPIKNQYWDLTEVADALHKYNNEHNIETDYLKRVQE